MTSLPPSDNAERLEYLYFNLVGQVVQVYTVDGAILEGLFVSRTDAESDEEPGIYLNCTRFLASKLHKPTDPAEFSAEPQLVQYKDIVLVSAVAVKLRTEVPGAGNVSGFRGQHDLKNMDWAEAPDDPMVEEGLEDQPYRPGHWNQFTANEELFGVTTSYREEIYTTSLDKTKFSKEDIVRADRIAREIDQSQTRGAQHRAERRDIADLAESEGELFSDVARKPTRAAAKEGGGKNAANAPAAPAPGPRRGVVEDAGAAMAASTGAAGDTNRKPNPAAMPFVPSRVTIADYIKTLAVAVRSNPNCFSTQPDWPGEAPNSHYDRDNSSYSQQPMMPPQSQPMPPHTQNSSYMPAFHHSHRQQSMPMPPGAHGNQGMVPGNYHAGAHHGYSAGPMGGFAMPPPQQPPHVQGYGEQGMQGMPPSRLPPNQGARPGGKTQTQPQQPVSAPVPHQQAPQAPPQSVVPAVESSAGAGEKPATGGKRLKRGGGGGSQRTESNAGDASGAGARRSAR